MAANALPDRPLRILLLEDNRDDAELLAIELEAAGLAVQLRRTTSRSEFESALAEGRPDLVISDSNLPGFSGQEALAHVRSLPTHVLFLFLSGQPQALLDADPALAKADARISKDRMAAVAEAIRMLTGPGAT